MNYSTKWESIKNMPFGGMSKISLEIISVYAKLGTTARTSQIHEACSSGSSYMSILHPGFNVISHCGTGLSHSLMWKDSSVDGTMPDRRWWFNVSIIRSEFRDMGSHYLEFNLLGDGPMMLHYPLCWILAWCLWFSIADDAFHTPLLVLHILCFSWVPWESHLHHRNIIQTGTGCLYWMWWGMVPWGRCMMYHQDRGYQSQEGKHSLFLLLAWCQILPPRPSVCPT